MPKYEIALLVTATAINAARVACFDPSASGLALSQGVQSTQGGVPSPSQPNQHPQQQPDQPSTTPNGNPNPIGVEGNAANGTPATRPAMTDRWDRPFALQTPQTEARLAEVGRRLATMEQRMARSNAEVLRRIGEARQMTGEKQGRAVMDILQQMAQDQAELQRYLVATRTAWAGEVESVAGAGTGGAAATGGSTIASPGGAGPREDINATPATPQSPGTGTAPAPAGGGGGAPGGMPATTNPPR